MTIQTNVFRRGTVYYHRVRVPIDLLELFRRKVIWRSLKTRIRQKARNRALLAGLALHNTFEFARKNTRMVTREQIIRIAQEYYSTLLEDDEIEQVSPPTPIPDWKLDQIARDHLEHLGETDEEIDASIRKNTRSVEEIVKISTDENEINLLETILEQKDVDSMSEFASELINKAGLREEPNTMMHRLLSLYTVRALVEARKISMARSQGNWTAASTDRLFRDFRRTGLEAPPVTSKSLKKAPPIPNLLDSYLKERKGLSTKYIDEFRVSVEWMLDYFGKDRTIDSFTPEDIVEYKDALLVTPVNFRKHFQNKSIKEAIAENKRANRKTLGYTSINNKRLGNIDSFFSWAVKNKYILENPATKIRVEEPPRRQGRKRDPLSIAQLNALFSSPHFTGCSSSTNWKESGDFLIRDHRYWLPLLSLWTGARLGEIAQMLVSDVSKDNDIWVIHITASDDEDNEENEKHLKNLESERDIPIHPELIRLGFIEYWQQKKKAAHKRLFSECKLGADGTYSPFSKHFRRVLDSVGIKKRSRSVFHSFRHGFEGAMREAGLEDSMRFRIGGRVFRHSSEEYSNYTIPSLYRAIPKIQYLGLDLRHLYPDPIGPSR